YCAGPHAPGSTSADHLPASAPQPYPAAPASPHDPACRSTAHHQATTTPARAVTPGPRHATASTPPPSTASSAPHAHQPWILAAPNATAPLAAPPHTRPGRDTRRRSHASPAPAAATRC